VVLFARYLSVFSSGIEALMAKVLLKQSKPVSRVVKFYCVDRKSITQAVRTHIVDSSSLRIYQLRQFRFFGAATDNLPGTVAVNTKNQSLPISKNRTATADVVFERAQSLNVTRQHPLSAVFLLLGLSLLNLTATPGTERMASAKPLSAPGAGQLQAGFEVFDANCAMVEVYVFNRQSQSLADPTTKTE